MACEWIDLFTFKAPFIVITIAVLFETWRRYRACKQIITHKVDDTSKGNCSRLVGKILSFSYSLEDQDRLSELPDDVLYCILRHLSLRDVARLTTLSRNWRKVCLTLSSLDLDCRVMCGNNLPRPHSEQCEPYRQAYVRSVDQVLNNYKDQNMLSLRLVCCFNEKYTADVDRWINLAAAWKGLQTLTLQGIGDVEPKYEQLLLINGSLISQLSYLKGLHLDCCILKLDSGFLLSNLTTLDLHRVTLEGTAQWQTILSCSSTIQRLWLRWCNVPQELCIGESFRRLSCLLIGCCSSLREVQLSARNLKHLELFGSETFKCSFLNVPRLERLHLFHKDGNEGFFNILAGLPGLKSLYLRTEFPLIHELPSYKIFHTVLCLRIYIRSDDGNIVPALPRLLKAFPLLERLEIQLPRYSQCEYYELPIPCAHTNLKVITLYYFDVLWLPVAKCICVGSYGAY